MQIDRKKISDCIEKFPTKDSIFTEGYLKDGKFSIIDQGGAFIAGYTNNQDLVHFDNLPIIIFGDHTRIFKYIDFPFVLGADGTKVLKPKSEFDPRYFYYAMLAIDLGSRGYSRHFKLLKEKTIPLPPLSIQKEIVAELDAKMATIKALREKRIQQIADTEKILPALLAEIFEQGKKDGWEEASLKNVANYFIGLTYSPGNVSDEGTIVLRSSNIQDDELTFNDIVRVNGVKIKENLLVQKDDILMCSRNGSKRLIGKTAKINDLTEQMTFGAFMTIIRSNANAFLYWFFKSRIFFDQFSNDGGPMINQITKYMLDEIKVPLPPLPTQKDIVARLDATSKRVKTLKLAQEAQLADLFQLEKAILREVFEG